MKMILFLCIVIHVIITQAEIPEQIHLGWLFEKFVYALKWQLELIKLHLASAFGRTPDVMSVQWSTMDMFCTTGSYVEYGVDSNNLDQYVEGNCRSFNLTNQVQMSTHVAYMIKLGRIWFVLKCSYALHNHFDGSHQLHLRLI
jgi:hypothetical protein